MEPLLRLRRYLCDQRQVVHICLRNNEERLAAVKDPTERRALKRRRKFLQQHYDEICHGVITIQELIADIEAQVKSAKPNDAYCHNWKWLGVVHRG